MTESTAPLSPVTSDSEPKKDSTAKISTSRRLMAGATWLILGVVFGCLGSNLVLSIPMVNELPEGVNSPLEYVLNEAATRFAFVIAFAGLLGIGLGIVGMLFPGEKTKWWLEIIAKMIAFWALLFSVILAGFTLRSF